MPEIKADFDGQTVICTFEMTPATATELMEHLKAAYAECISKADGFLGAGLHMNDAQTRIATYSKWEKRGDYQAMLRSPEMIARNKVINTLCRGFEPVMYEVAADF
ncbi:antibiotic biosynthesis monooxygenase [Rhodobacter sp. TJ_12]|uniref:antibiotic biosynthesis monooxygenase family protein n=1 Tax=Rhodobacter sp. TJ_12 TaxID=2029399 RepID=UPI001CC0919D|nr:antibiotic biosynthesis monooxygenase [Rhodobacter sp. TJ_12]MBZ4021873.1 antibiotic biosynthesis monooxygenase [Rhodobacter sp. TJ_12]